MLVTSTTFGHPGALSRVDLGRLNDNGVSQGVVLRNRNGTPPTRRGVANLPNFRIGEGLDLATECLSPKEIDVCTSSSVIYFSLVLLGFSLAQEASSHDIVSPEDYKLHRILHGIPEGATDIPPSSAFPMDSNLDMMGAGQWYTFSHLS